MASAWLAHRIVAAVRTGRNQVEALYRQLATLNHSRDALHFLSYLVRVFGVDRPPLRLLQILEIYLDWWLTRK